MKPETEDSQPFLGFRDDPTKRSSGEDEEGGGGSENAILHQQHALKTSRTRRYLRDFLVFLATSLVWVLAFSFLPGPQVPTNSPSPSMPTPPPPKSSPSKGLPSPLPQVGQDGKAGSTVPGPDFIAQTHNVTSGAQLVSCGNSTQEAKKNGCWYDTLLNHWVPAPCYDREFEQEYMDDDTWHAYADVNLTQRLTREEMGDHESYYTSIEDHVNHCSMFWKKQFWTLFEERRTFDAVIVNNYHTEHCADFLKDIYGSNRTEPTFVKVEFSACWVRPGEGKHVN